MRKILIIDTSILCVWLKVDQMENAGKNNAWNFHNVNEKIEQEIENKTTLVLPLATIIETGNHIAQSAKNRYENAQKLAEIIIKASDGKSPWAVFTQQSPLWDTEELKKLADEWKNLAVEKISIGDATIKKLAEYYAKMNFNVEIFTGDEGLKSYEPSIKMHPMRRKR
jgi:hypothetical protein